METPKLFKTAEKEIHGWPTEVITGMLLVIGVGLIVLAFVPGHPLFKAGVLAWVILP